MLKQLNTCISIINELYKAKGEIITQFQDAGKKCYVLIVSETFPKDHVRAGEKTGFIEPMAIIHFTPFRYSR